MNSFCFVSSSVFQGLKPLAECLTAEALDNISFIHLSVAKIISLDGLLERKSLRKITANMFYRISKLMTFQISYLDESNVCECPSRHILTNIEQKGSVCRYIGVFSLLYCFDSNCT